MPAYFEMLRPVNCIMAAFAVLIGGMIVFGLSPDVTAQMTMLKAMAAAFLIAGAGNAINDVMDVEADKTNRPKRPISSGKATKSGATAFSAVLFLAGIALALTINLTALAIAAFNALMLIAYSAWLKHRAYVGHAAVSYIVASTFIFGGAAMGSVNAVALLALMAFFANFAREIVKGLEDVEGDGLSFIGRAKAKLKRAAAKIAERFKVKKGKAVLAYDARSAVVIAMTSLVASVCISPLPLFLGIFSTAYMLAVIPADIALLACVVQLGMSTSRPSLSKVSKLIKAGMLLGLLAFVMGSLY